MGRVLGVLPYVLGLHLRMETPYCAMRGGPHTGMRESGSYASTPVGGWCGGVGLLRTPLGIRWIPRSLVCFVVVGWVGWFWCCLLVLGCCPRVFFVGLGFGLWRGFWVVCWGFSREFLGVGFGFGSGCCFGGVLLVDVQSAFWGLCPRACGFLLLGRVLGLARCWGLSPGACLL